MQLAIPIKGRLGTPQPAAPLTVFLDHPLLWWAGLNAMEQLSVLVIASGVVVLTGTALIWLWQEWRGLASASSHRTQVLGHK